MNVRTRLRGAFALYIALLVALSYYHVRTTQQSTARGRALAEIASRMRVMSTIQLSRIAQANTDARKYVVTRDTGYLDKLDGTMSEFESEIRRLDSLTLSAGELTEKNALAEEWRGARAAAAVLRRAPVSGLAAAETALEASLDRTATRTQALGVASQDAMTRELDAADAAQESTERLSLLGAGGAVLLSLILSALLARSILNPLALLTTGTHEVSEGRFAYRLDARGKDELAQVAREFNSMTERLDELDRMKKDFVSKVSHDLKTPLSSMQETTSVLLDEIAGPLTPKQRQLLQINHDSGDRLFAMLAKLLDLSRVEAGLEPEMRVLDPHALVARSVNPLSTAAEGTAARVSLSVAEGASRFLVRGDADRLAQVVDNLIDNAIKFSPEHGSVSVRVTNLTTRGNAVPAERWAALQRHGGVRGAVLVSVADEGPGVPDAEKERVFTRFYQTDAGRAVRSRGVGLGLTICQEIVIAHGGSIWVEDNHPRGSVFQMLLPAAQAVGAAESPSEPALAVSRGRQE